MYCRSDRWFVEPQASLKKSLCSVDTYFLPQFIVNTYSVRRYLPHFIKVFFNRLIRTEGHPCDDSVQLVKEILFPFIIFIHRHNLLYFENDYGINIFLCKTENVTWVFLKLETIQRYQVTWLPTLKNSCQVLFFFWCKE